MNNLHRSIIFITAISLIIWGCKKDEEETPVNNAPVASFTVNPESGNIQTEFNLDASACSDVETPAEELLVRWDGNDDGVWDTDYSTNKQAIVTFEQAGTFTIRLEVKDGGGATASATRQVIVSGNLAPDLPSNPVPADLTSGIGLDAELQWTASDPEQDPLTFDIYFGIDPDPASVATGISSNTYDPGTLNENTKYYWKVVVHDTQGNETTGPVWSFQTTGTSFSCGDVFIDSRNGQEYPTVQIGDQCWMAKNMNIGERIDGAVNMSDDDVIEKYCYDDEDASCDTYGGLYQWDEMLQHSGGIVRGICPVGWHIPSLEEWQQLEIDLGMPEEQATATTGWQGSNEGDLLKEGGSSGFNALMSGHRRIAGTFLLGNYGTAFWTSTQASTFIATARSLDVDHSQINHTNYDKKYGHAVRCVKD